MLRRVAAFCRLLRPVLLLVSFPRSRSPVVGVLGLCWLRWDVPPPSNAFLWGVRPRTGPDGAAIDWCVMAGAGGGSEIGLHDAPPAQLHNTNPCPRPRRRHSTSLQLPPEFQLLEVGEVHAVRVVQDLLALLVRIRARQLLDLRPCGRAMGEGRSARTHFEPTFSANAARFQGILGGRGGTSARLDPLRDRPKWSVMSPGLCPNFDTQATASEWAMKRGIQLRCPQGLGEHRGSTNVGVGGPKGVTTMSKWANNNITSAIPGRSASLWEKALWPLLFLPIFRVCAVDGEATTQTRNDGPTHVPMVEPPLLSTAPPGVVSWYGKQHSMGGGQTFGWRR